MSTTTRITTGRWIRISSVFPRNGTALRTTLPNVLAAPVLKRRASQSMTGRSQLIFNSSLGNTSVPDSLSSLQHAKIDLYLTSFLQPDEIRSKCFASLSHSERARTGSDQQGSWRFIFSRGTMRLLLARSLRCHPTELEIRSNPHGKPYLPDLAMHFNL